MAEELKGPGIFEIRQFIKEKCLVEFYTLNDKIFRGNILWFDGDSFHITLQDNQELTLLKSSIVYYNKVTEL